MTYQNVSFIRESIHRLLLVYGDKLRSHEEARAYRKIPGNGRYQIQTFSAILVPKNAHLNHRLFYPQDGGYLIVVYR